MRPLSLREVLLRHRRRFSISKQGVEEGEVEERRLASGTRQCGGFCHPAAEHAGQSAEPALGDPIPNSLTTSLIICACIERPCLIAAGRLVF